MKVFALLFVCVGAALAREPEKKTCDEDPEPGMCLAYFPKYYYDRATGTCKKFIYGGCQGNGNRYNTEEECLQNCAERERSATDVCKLQPETGMCKAYMPRFYYNPESGKCEKFVYGGCGGNGNNFHTEDHCYSTCGRARALDLCSLDAESGPCRAYFPSYFFNSKTGKCEEFIYGGCLGNANRFETEEDCYSTCGAQAEDNYCLLEAKVGPCRGAFTRFFFNKEKGVCEEFIYGGCDGNKNNFLTYRDCADACGET